MASVLLDRETVDGEACQALLDNKWDEYLEHEDEIIAMHEREEAEARARDAAAVSLDSADAAPTAPVEAAAAQSEAQQAPAEADFAKVDPGFVEQAPAPHVDGADAPTGEDNAKKDDEQ